MNASTTWRNKIKRENPEQYRAFLDRNNTLSVERYSKRKEDPILYQKQLEEAYRWRRTHREKHLEIVRLSTQKLRLEVLAAYGGKCACCGEDREVFLCIDHVNGDGAKHRRSLHKISPKEKRLGGGGERVWRWARKNGFPSTLQVLCRNCNWAKERGPCPHHAEII